MEGQESVLDALVHLEEAELQQYCEAVSVEGFIAQTVTLTLKRGQRLWASRGGLLAYSSAVDWHLAIPGGAGKAVGRMLSGEGLSLARITAQRDGQTVVLSANRPGRLVTWDLSRGPIVCTPGAFVAALGQVNIDVTTARSAGAMFFGGAGLFLQKLSGTGIVVVHGAGDLVEHHLKTRERLLVSTGNLAFFSARVRYDVRGVGGCFKALAGGEGLFMTELTGPGWVMLQSLKTLPATKRTR